MSRRRRAREVVMQLLYRDDLNGVASAESDQRFLSKRLNANAGLVKFADTILQGVRQYSEQIDTQLETIAENWTLSRMAATDRNILRVATWEIMFSDTPPAVAIDEAIELAKRYGAVDSPKFVNGLLDRLVKQSVSSNLSLIHI